MKAPLAAVIAIGIVLAVLIAIAFVVAR